jgi:hypothetical protein
MWGVKLSQDRPQIAGLFQKILNMEHKDYYGYDQTFLKDYIWPIAQTNMVRIFIEQLPCYVVNKELNKCVWQMYKLCLFGGA